jgi:micrococcal nuclease
MQFLRIVGLVMIAATATQRVSGPEVVVVQSVTDGGGIDVGAYGRVRLAGIRVPRAGRRGMDGEPFGREARERLEGMVAHRYVRLEFPAAISRSSAYVLLEDGTFVNAVLVREGLARMSGRTEGARHDALARAEEEARAARRGLWGERTPQLRNSATPN